MLKSKIIKLFLGFIFLLAAFPSRGGATDLEVCPRLVIQGQERVDFTEPERLLICGDPKNYAWNNIPANQAIFNLRSFLQQRGYYFPVIEVKEARLYVRLGEPTRVKEFHLTGESSSIEKSNLRRIENERLTPALLDEVKKRLTRILNSQGYACPNVKMSAIAETGELTADILSGPRLNVLRVREEPIQGLRPDIMERYRAFLIGEPYNGDFLEVTVNRIIDSGIVQSTFFKTECDPMGAVVTQKFVPGPPRVVSIGVGVDTEKLLFSRASWSNNRLGYHGSKIEVVAEASFREQILRSTLNWYHLPYPSRFFLQPAASVRRQKEIHFESYSADLSFSPAGTWDNQTLGARFSLGPSLNFVKTVVGDGPKDSDFLSLLGMFELKSHYSEFYRTSPRDGFVFRFEMNLAQKDWLANVSVKLLRATFQKDWNLYDLDPAFLVVSLRGALATTLTNLPINTVPLPYRHFLGGSTDLRGFARKDLPSKFGALTSAFAGLELRFADSLPWQLQPFAFVDAGIMGEKTVSLDLPVFWSPGVGMRWESKFAVIRTTLARGVSIGESTVFGKVTPHWQFYFSFGEEF